MIGAAIQAGGKATRMGGRPKSFVEVDGRRIIDRQLEVLRPLFAEILLVANQPERYAELGLPMMGDVIADAGPLGGFVSALEAARSESLVMVACDMPYIDERAVRCLLEPPAAFDVVVPMNEGRPEPLFARYSRRCAAAIRSRLAAGERRVIAFFDDVRVTRIVLPDPRVLHNCNSPADLL